MEEIQVVNVIEDRVLAQRRRTKEDEIIKEATKWVSDPANPQTRDTRYFRMVEAYWMVKALVAQVVNETHVRRIQRSSKLFTFWRESSNFSADPNMASSSGSTSQSNVNATRERTRN
jgi:hypothetical protein